MNPKWDKRFLELAEHVSTWSKDPSTQVGCVIANDDRRVVALGINGFPKGIEDSEERLNDRETKYKYVVQLRAERLCERNGLGSWLHDLHLPLLALCRVHEADYHQRDQAGGLSCRLGGAKGSLGR